MTFLRTLKNLTPLAARRFLKHQLPTALVAAIATSAQPSKMGAGGQKLAKRLPSPSHVECPICGTALRLSGDAQPIQCTGCGSLPHHRRLALAIYAATNETHQRILVLGSDGVTKAIFEGMSNVSSAEDLTALPPGMPLGIDLCVHSYRLAWNPFRLGKLLRAADALLSPKGRQIFLIDGSSGAWGPIKWRQEEGAIIQWLQTKGWPHCSVFEPEALYGKGASEVFGCTAPEDTIELVVTLPKARA